ncbi:MAG TPA: EAL domain-containing protein [Acidimicrobiales bacterium]|nr:EAL domain-containing protein [Acidimicrobiales bacterium]
MPGLGTWSAQQLAEFLAVVSAFPDEHSALLGALERAAEAVEAEVAALVRGDEVVVAVGFPLGRVPTDDVVRVARSQGDLDVPGVGRCVVARIPIDEPLAATLVLARSGEPFERAEAGLLRGMARVLGLTVEMLRVVDRERALRQESEAQADENAHLLAGLQERQHLLEQLFKIQRSISHRAPIDGVLDAITQGAAELLGDEVVGLRLIDEERPDTMVMVSSVGLSPQTLSELRCVPVTQGVGGRCVVEQRLVIADDYQTTDLALPQLVADGLEAAMAAPVHRNGTVVGSLVVGTRKAGRCYTETEQEVLLAFAEHASLALNDASALEAMRRAFGEAVHQATHDALTGLPNRTLVIDRLTHALARSRRTPRGLAVLFVDLDRFKVVNDSLGHSVGDEVLIQIAERLQSAVRPGDTVSRLAGDEFVVVCEEFEDEADLLRLGERMAHAIARPLHLYGRETIITASIGIAIACPETRAEDLLRDADVAMYRAKERGRSRIEVFDEAMRTRMLDRLETEHALRVAIQQGALVLHYQPTVCLTTGRVLSFEALVRWQHPERGLVPPSEFVPLAEDTGLIVPLGRWALRTACEQLAAWRTARPELDHLQVSVNLSARQFADPHLVALVSEALAASALPPDRLWLEITESALMEEAEATVDTLRALRALGVRISIDDFGTGYSSLSYLKRFPVDVLKIDRSFVDGLGVDPEDQAIVTAIVSLARALGLGVVAEGVETAEQLDEVRRLGCNSVQGYYLGRPRVASEALERLPSKAMAG